ncbi:MAG: hypothetical protein NW700_17525 [Nitrospiraceae bacterium]
MAIGNTDHPKDSPAFSARFPERYVYLMVYLLMCNGLRSHEVQNLKAESMDLQKGILTITSRKTLKTRQIRIPPVVNGMLAVYLKESPRARGAAMTRLAKLRRFFHLN